MTTLVEDQGKVFAGEKQPKALVKAPESSAPLYKFELPDIDGHPIGLQTFKGKVLLIVNTASMCGNTPQYARSSGKCMTGIETVDF
ncbi:MAG: hypothetical protein HC938_11115, partial [Nitrospira sp.]|nr:hypothetical protein [Nitrospira sp.]